MKKISEFPGNHFINSLWYRTTAVANRVWLMQINQVDNPKLVSRALSGEVAAKDARGAIQREIQHALLEGSAVIFNDDHNRRTVGIRSNPDGSGLEVYEVVRGMIFVKRNIHLEEVKTRLHLSKKDAARFSIEGKELVADSEAEGETTVVTHKLSIASVGRFTISILRKDESELGGRVILDQQPSGKLLVAMPNRQQEAGQV